MAGPISTKPIDGGGGGGAWAAPLRSLYEAILADLDYEMDRDYRSALEGLRRQVGGAERTSELIELGPEVRRAVLRFVRQTIADREGATAFIGEILNRLAEVEAHFKASANHTLGLRDAGRKLSDSVNEQIVEMGSSVESATRLDDLKRLVRERIENVEQALAGYQRDEKQQVRAVSQEIEQLRCTVRDVKDQLCKIEEERQELAERVRVDPLTGAANRLALDERLHQEMERMRRHGRPVSLAMVDLDRFKDINDKFGHVIGDKCLKEVVSRLSKGLRANDLLTRYGGEEFVVVLPETDAEQGREAAEKLRGLISGTEFMVRGGKLPVTVSIGVAQARPQDTSGSDLLSRADRALYDAKEGGRNRVAVAP